MGRRGASPSVARALDEAGKTRIVSIPEIRIERDDCKACGAALRFDVEREYGRSIEACTNLDCPNSTPHLVRPDMKAAAAVKDPIEMRIQEQRAKRRAAKRAESGETIRPRGNPTFGRSSEA